MATNTYVALATQTLGSTASTVTFSSIPATYTDLFVIISCPGTTTGGDWVMSVNNDSGTNYSRTYLYGTGSVAGSGRSTNTTAFALGGGRTDGYCKINIMNYSNTTTYKSALWNIGSAGTDLAPMVGLWRSTAAINRIDFINATYPVGSTFSLYGIAAQVTPGTAKATGGTITYDNFGRVIHTFTSSGTFTPSVPLTCDYLVVAGGGAGGSSVLGYQEGSGGGGGGGMRSSVSSTGGTGSVESQLALTTTAYTVTVGAGGAAVTGNIGANGNDSTLSTITSLGGGRAGSAGISTGAGANGGSGGGAAGYGVSTVATGSSNQGYNGGTTTGSQTGSGGGGAGSSAGNASTTNAGGSARSNSISSSSLSYSGGGGGGGAYTSTIYPGGSTGGTAGTNAGNGGNGTAASGSGNAGASATANFGGGGGGSSNGGASAAQIGGNGGSGIVIIRYQG